MAVVTGKIPSKPCILIYCFPHAGCEQKIREVTAGMEEEGIPSSVMNSTEHDSVALAYEGAVQSQLGVGVGIGDRQICIHYVKLPAGQPLFRVDEAGNPLLWRYCGYNAARLVKGIPFKALPERVGEAMPVRTETTGQSLDSTVLYSLIASIVTKVLQE